MTLGGVHWRWPCGWEGTWRTWQCLSVAVPPLLPLLHSNLANTENTSRGVGSAFALVAGLTRRSPRVFLAFYNCCAWYSNTPSTATMPP